MRTLRNSLLVFVGGAVGTGARFLLSAAFPARSALPVTLVINVTGAFLLGFLTVLIAVRMRGAIGGLLTALLGTGLLGGYTTYGMFALDTDGLLDSAHLGASIAYGLATIVLGFGAAALGWAIAAPSKTANVRDRVR
jgi:fluoride exporter